MRWVFLNAGLLLFMVQVVSGAEMVNQYFEACDGSAAVPLSSTTFLSATDDNNILRVYEIGRAEPLQRLDLEKVLPQNFLHLSKKKKEMDLEGAALVGDTAYWITSHGSGKDNRRRLFATRVKVKDQKIHLEEFGSAAYDSLIDDLDDAPEWKPIGIKKAAKKEPDEAGGLNIEGLAALQDALFIGFRNPLFDNKAIILQATKLERLQKGKAPEFAAPIILDLGGLGIRSLEYSVERGSFFIVAGPFKKTLTNPVYKLYEWDGPPATTVRLMSMLDFEEHFQPESIFSPPKSTKGVYILSDDGTRLEKGSEICKDVHPQDRRFRGVWISLP